SIEPKNFVIRVQASLRTGSFANTARVFMIATSRDSPIVSGTKMKWYTVVMPNCHRARSRASMDPPERTTRCQESYGGARARGGDHGPDPSRLCGLSRVAPGARAPLCHTDDGTLLLRTGWGNLPAS